jgi:hypothetical protein
MSIISNLLLNVVKLVLESHRSVLNPFQRLIEISQGCFNLRDRLPKRLTQLPLIVTYVPHVCIKFALKNIFISSSPLCLLILLKCLIHIFNFIPQSFYFSVKLKCLLKHLFNCGHFIIFTRKNFLKESIVSAGLSIEIFV